MDDYIVYIKTDEEGRIIAVNSSAFLDDTADWIQIDSGVGDKYHMRRATIWTSRNVPTMVSISTYLWTARWLSALRRRSLLTLPRSPLRARRPRNALSS